MARQYLLLAAILIAISPAYADFNLTANNSATGAAITTFNTTFITNLTWYQEFANVSDGNGSLSTGSYYSRNDSGTVYVNYSVPNNTDAIYWQVKAYHSGLIATTVNYTIPDECVATNVRFKMLSYGVNGSGNFGFGLYCFNSGDQEVIVFVRNLSSAGIFSVTEYDSSRLYDGSYSTGAGFELNTQKWRASSDAVSALSYIFEEGVWWNRYTETNYSTTNGTIGILHTYLANTSLSLQTSALGYLDLNTSGVNGTTNVAVNLTPITLNISIRDSVSFGLITEILSVYVTGDSISYNYSTATGLVNVPLLYPGFYTITVNSSNYSQNTFVYEVTEAANLSTTLYLIRGVNGSYIRFTVLDQSYAVLEGAVITALQRNLSGTNYYNVGGCTTDGNGECIMYLQTLTTTYRFLTSYNSVIRNTSDTVLSRDTYTIILNTASSTLQSVLGRDDISASLVYTPVGRFDYTVVDSNGVVQSGLMTVERRYGGRLYSISSTTASGSSFIITESGVNVSLGDEIVANGYVFIGNQSVLTHSISVIDSSAGGALNGGLAFLFLGMLFTIVFIFAWNPVAPLIAFGAFLIIMSRIGIIGIGMGAVVAILVVIGVAIYRMRSV